MTDFTASEIVDHFNGCLSSEDSFYLAIAEECLVNCTNYANVKAEDLTYMFCGVQDSIEESINQYPENWTYLMESDTSPQDALTYHFKELFEY